MTPRIPQITQVGTSDYLWCLCNLWINEDPWLKTELLHPVDKGGKIRSYNMLKELKRNCHITYLTLDDGTADCKRARARERILPRARSHSPRDGARSSRPVFTSSSLLNLASSLPYAIKKYESPEMRQRDCKASSRRQRFDVLVCDFWRRP